MDETSRLYAAVLCRLREGRVDLTYAPVDVD
jgi:hypothetical protein